LKHLLLYGPILWLRKVVVYLLITAIILGLSLYFVANSPFVIKKLADAYAPDYNISYSRIYGNVLTGLEIEDLAYNDDSLAKHITLKWNPNGLMKKKIIVSSLQIEKANVDTIKMFIASFSSTENNESNESSTSEPLDIGVSVHHASLSLEPFDEQGIGISSAKLNARGIAYASGNVNIAKLVLKVDSNVTNLLVNAKVKKNALEGQVRLTPAKALFELYALPVRKEAVGDIVIGVTASEKQVVADVDTEMKQLLKSEKDGFNLDIERLQSHVVYDLSSKRLTADSKIILSTPYAKDIVATNLFTMDDNISYSGNIQAKQIIGVDAKFVKPLNHLVLQYTGNIQSIKADIQADNLQGTFVSDDFKKAKLHLETLEAIQLGELVQLPAELNQTKANIVINVPIIFDTNASIIAEAKIHSNVINVDSNVSYDKRLKVKAIANIPEESLLRPYSKELKWDSLIPIMAEAQLTDEGADLSLKAGTLSTNLHYTLESKKVDGKMVLGGLQADISGMAEEKININTKINSMASLVKSVNTIYTLTDVPSVKGSADIVVEITKLKKIAMIIKSPEIIYEPDQRTVHQINDIDFAFEMEGSTVQLKRYSLSYAKQKLFSTKPSTVSFEDDVLTISPLWLNDQLQITGEYNTKIKKGNISTQADRLETEHEIIDLASAVDIQTLLDGNKTSVKGKVTLLDGDIHYDLNQKTYASDSDIIIVQDIKEKKESPFMDNLSVMVQIQTKKPLVYKKGDINIEAKVDMQVYKAEYSELMLLGSVEILEGGSYTFENKKFVFDQSYVYFTGNPNKPLIEASLKYRSLKHLITIAVTGTADMPKIKFSSKPSLTKEQILSIILFGSEGGAGVKSGEDMMKMMGGAMAKSALSNLGVELDYLALGAEGSVEVGKKLTDDMTIIYINDTVPTVKLKYQHGKRTESVFGVSEESQSYDIIYKRDF